MIVGRLPSAWRYRFAKPVRLVLIACAAIASAATHTTVHAQGPATLTGQVRDETGAPVASAQVRLVGSARVAQTNDRGEFLLNGLPVGDAVVDVRRIGFAPQKVAQTLRAGANTIAVTLSRSALSLENVVVTGQGGEIEQRRLSTTIDVITREEIEGAPVTRLDQLLQAKLPSAQIRMMSGQAGTGSLIRTRGINSVSTNSTPVIYVDGVRVDNLNTPATLGMNLGGNAHQGNATSAIADLPLDNIERIEYVPGGAATTLYGSDAANGVIQIFTRKGSGGPTRFTFSAQVGTDTPQTQWHFFDRTKDLLYRNGTTQQYSGSMEGGSGGFSFSVSGSARASESHRVEGENSALAFRSGVGAEMGTRGRYTGSLSYSQDFYPRFRNGNSPGYNSLWFSEGGRSNAFGFNPDLTLLTDSAWNAMQTFVARAEQLQDNSVRVRRFTTSHGVSYQANDALLIKGTVGLDQRLSTERAITTNEYLIHIRSFPAGTSDRGSIQNFQRTFAGLTAELNAQHSATLGPLSFISVIGGQLFRNDDEQIAYTATNVRDGAETITGAGVTAGADATLRVANYGLYGQTNVGIFDRLFVELGVRADQNTAFGTTVGAQYYPKLGLAYDLSGESWFRRAVPSAWVSQFRFRGNYGVAGNFPRPFANDETIAFNSLGGALAATLGQPGNEALRPERTRTYEGGFDISFAGERATISATVYNSRTTDALLNAPSPPSTGAPAQLRNVGEISNAGSELRGTVVPIAVSGARLTLSASYNTLRNRMVNTGGTPVFNLGGFSERTIQAVVEAGQPVGYLRGARTNFDAQGNRVRTEFLQFLGKPHPDKFGIMSAQLQLGSRLTIGANADYQFGASSHSFDRHFRFLYGLPQDALPDVVVATNQRSAIWLDVFDRFVEKTDYVKMRTLTADYRLPESIVPRGASSARVALAITNPWAWSASSFDPEVDLSGAIGQGSAAVGGINYSTDSSARSFLMTISLGF